MTEEIKGILEKPNVYSFGDECYLYFGDYNKLKHYITNLQEKYEEADNDRHKLFEQKEKAIKYIKEEGTTYLNLANQRKWCNEFSAENILKILGGVE